MSHKIGEKTSTSLLPWTHGPRWDYSRSIPEAIMVMEEPPEINPPSDRVPGQELLLIPISGLRWRRNSGENMENESSLRISSTKGINRRKVGHQGWAHLARRQGGAASPWPRQVAAWPGGGSPLAPLRASGVFLHKRFFGIFLDFSGNIDFSPFFCDARTKTDKN